jgi:hypothetical protein
MGMMMATIKTLKNIESDIKGVKENVKPLKDILINNIGQ